MKSGHVVKPVAKPDHVAIQRAIAAIPAGRVASYGEIAMRAGFPGRARLVGKLLGDSDSALKLPWHRVLRSSGQTAFAPGSRGFREQSQRLRTEGVVIVNGRVDLQRFGWERNLDVELWGPRESTSKKSRAAPKPSRDAKTVTRRR
jgi:methylated-DNA-protein-cysteine methyltransferase related protein